MKQFNETFTFLSPINRETSYGTTPLAKEAKSEITVFINEDGDGGFQWVVEELEIEENGGLWFEDQDTLIDYDGVFELPEQLITFLEKKGYNMDYAKP